MSSALMRMLIASSYSLSAWLQKMATSVKGLQGEHAEEYSVENKERRMPEETSGKDPCRPCVSAAHTGRLVARRENNY